MRFPKVFVNTNPRVLCRCGYRESSAAVPTYLGARYPHGHKHPRVRVQSTEIELAQCPLGALRHFSPPLLPVRSALNKQGGASTERLTRGGVSCRVACQLTQGEVAAPFKTKCVPSIYTHLKFVTYHIFARGQL